MGYKENPDEILPLATLQRFHHNNKKKNCKLSINGNCGAEGFGDEPLTIIITEIPEEYLLKKKKNERENKNWTRSWNKKGTFFLIH